MLPHDVPHWVSHLRLSFLICEMGIMLVLIVMGSIKYKINSRYLGYYEKKNVELKKVLRQVFLLFDLHF